MSKNTNNIFSKIEPAYLSKEGCRLIWNAEKDDQHAVLLNKEELEQLVEVLKNNNTGKVDLEDGFSGILINSDVAQFRLKNMNQLEAQTSELRKQVLDYAKVPHEPLYVQVASKEFYPSVLAPKDESADSDKTNKEKEKKLLLDAILSANPKQTSRGEETIPESDLFRVMSTRRSKREFAISISSFPHSA